MTPQSPPRSALRRRATRTAVAVAAGLCVAWFAAIGPAAPVGDGGVAYAQLADPPPPPPPPPADSPPPPPPPPPPADSPPPPPPPVTQPPAEDPPSDPGARPQAPAVVPPPGPDPQLPAASPPADPDQSDIPSSPLPKPPAAANSAIKGSYIVVYTSAVKDVAAQTRIRESRLGFEHKLLYSDVIAGFAAQLSPRQVRALRDDPKVESVESDRRLSASNTLVPLVAPNEHQPTGVLRTIAGLTPAVSPPGRAGVAANVAVAVLDTGITLNHLDLNVRPQAKSCVGSEPTASDLNGHGTHVAGTIGARNNGAGVVGVAPATALHAVKVLNKFGSGSAATVLCGLNWVMANRGPLKIRVINMSLAGLVSTAKKCGDTTAADYALHLAICKLTKPPTGPAVNVVVAAGNHSTAFDKASGATIPAVYPEVLTTTAMGDFNGRELPAGAPKGCTGIAPQPDDTAAFFSNYASTDKGMAHTIAAPGVCIVSSGLNPFFSKAVKSGTSMAAPHMAAELALCLATTCAGKTTAQVIKLMRDDAADYTLANPNYGFTGDPQHGANKTKYYGFLYRTLRPVPTSCPSNLFVLDVTAATPIVPSPFVQVSGGGPRRGLVIDFKPSLTLKCSQANIVVEYKGLPTGWTVNIGDSSTNDGYGGGSGGTTESCAEVWVQVTLIGANKHCPPPTLAAAMPLLPSMGTLSLRDGSLKFIVRDQFVSVGQPYATPVVADGPKSFHLPDTFGPNPDGYKIYAGLNGVIDPSSNRSGTGVRRVYVVMQ